MSYSRSFETKNNIFLYRSHDGFVELPSGLREADKPLSPYASQQKVFDDLGRDVLKNAFDGKLKCSNLFSIVILFS